MEETIWMLFGVLGMIIALGIIGPLLFNQTKTFSNEQLEFQVEKISNQADFLCNTGVGNIISVPVTLYYNTTLYTNEDRLCIKSQKGVSCERSICRYDDFNFTLEGDLAEKLEKIDYTCTLEVFDRGFISIRCEA